ncbi:MAG: hypothetical protein ACI4MU_12755 [Candidatus Ventricola sp.]
MRNSELGLLLRIQAYRFCGVNALRHGHDKRQRRRAMGALCLGLGLAAMAAGYSAMFALMLAQIGAADAIPQILAMAAAAIALVVVMTKGPELIFGGQDVASLRAMPVRTGTIVLSRMIGVLLPLLGTALLMGVPAAIVYAMNGAGAAAGVRLVLALCFVPAVPAALALLAGTVIARLTLRMRHRSIVAAALSIVLVLAVLGGTFAMGFAAERGTLTESMMLVLLGRFTQLLAGLYPPADWVAAAAKGSAAAWLWLAGTAFAALLATLVLATLGFARISDGLSAGTARGRSDIRRIRAVSPLRSLYRKERMRYLSSTIYLMNTSVGWLMLLMAAGALCFVDVKPYLSLLSAVPGVGGQLLWLLVLVPTVLGGMACPTACSISMEGKQMELMRALPVRMRHWLGAKMLLHLTLAVPSILVFALIAVLRLGLSAGQTAMLVLYPLSASLMNGVCGLVLNLHFPRFDWTQDTQAVKQGMSVLLAMLIGMLVPIGVGALGIWLGTVPVVLGVACAVQLAAAAGLWGLATRMRMP